MVNKYPGICIECRAPVAVNAGELKKSKRGRYYVIHPACKGGPSVISFRYSSGHTSYQNSKGRCEDATCCGCCTV